MTQRRLQDFMPGSPANRMTPTQRTWLSDRIADAHIGVVGATGAVGLEALALLSEAGIPIKNIVPIGSARSVGQIISYGGSMISLVPFEQLGDVNVVVMATPASVSEQLAPIIADRGIAVSDNSSAFRSKVPLIIPEINGQEINADTPIVASPNCTTTIALTAIEGVRQQFGISSLEIASYQAVSGAGLAAMNALIDESVDATAGKEMRGRWQSEPAAFNIFPHESPIDPQTGWCAEEQKFLSESAQILQAPGIATLATCVRVPALRTHTIAVRIHTQQPCEQSGVRDAIELSQGTRHVDIGPSSLAASGICHVLVGRPMVIEAPLGDGSIVRVLVAGDQLLKGAAWNALQNAAIMHERRQSQRNECTAHSAQRI